MRQAVEHRPRFKTRCRQKVGGRRVVGEGPARATSAARRFAAAPIFDRRRRSNARRVKNRREKLWKRAIDSDGRREDSAEQRLVRLQVRIDIIDDACDVDRIAAGGNSDDVQVRRVGLFQRRRPCGGDRAAGIALDGERRLPIEPEGREL